MGSRPERVDGHIGIENGPDSYGRQQLRIFHNKRGREWPCDDVNPGISPG